MSHHAQMCLRKRLQVLHSLCQVNSETEKMSVSWAEEKKNWTVAQWSKVFSSDESVKFISFSFGNLRSRVQRKSVEGSICLKSSLKFEVSDDSGCYVICQCCSMMLYQIQSRQISLPHFTVHRALQRSFMEILISFSSRTCYLSTEQKQ